jgi:hypothetical protein
MKQSNSLTEGQKKQAQKYLKEQDISWLSSPKATLSPVLPGGEQRKEEDQGKARTEQTISPLRRMFEIRAGDKWIHVDDWFYTREGRALHFGYLVIGAEMLEGGKFLVDIGVRKVETLGDQIFTTL